MALVLKLVFFLIPIMIFLLGFESVADARHRSSADEKCFSNFGDAKDHLVTDLPGQPKVKFRHYAGYVNVNESNGRALFYWFYEAATLPDEKPLVLWLNGGPGCSSVGYGATQEIGPLVVDTDGRGLVFNPYAWNTEANLLFLESPIGVGYSYSNTSSDYDILGDVFATNDAYIFLHKWFLKFPSYQTREFYIAGESYAGKYVPELAELIHDKNKLDPTLFIDLRGILLGNPETSDAEDAKGMMDYAWSHAIVSDETHKIITESCNFYSNDPYGNQTCSDAVDELYRQYDEIDMYSLYTSVCNIPSDLENKLPRATLRSSLTRMPRVVGGYDPCMDDYALSYYNRREVQNALHVINDVGTRLKNWTICNMTVFHGWSDSKASVLPIYKKLIAANLRIWVYSGDTDGRVPFMSTRYSISSLGLPITMAWRTWYHKKQVGGWVQEYEGLTFATFRGAGHAVPLFKRSESLAFFAAFLSGGSLPYQRT